MPIALPDLDDRSYADLVREARALIPTYAPSWTDHNPSDPGITLVELFAWLTEMLIYRANRIPDHHLLVFLKLLNGPEWRPGTDLAADIRESVVALRRRHRAVTCGDYEALAGEASADVARVKCVPRRYLGAGTEADRTKPRPGHVSIIVVPRAAEPDAAVPQPSAELRQRVWEYLDARRALATRHHVVGPLYVPVNAEILIAARADVRTADLHDRVAAAVAGFLHPLTGGPDHAGWPFGRDIHLSELYQLLERVPGVDHVPDILLWSQCPPEAARCVPAAELWHESGDQIGLALAAHHLPLAAVDLERIVVSTAFVSVRASVAATAAAGVATAAARRAVKAAIRRRFHPLHGGPDGRSRVDIAVDVVRQVIDGLPEVESVVGLELSGDQARLLRDDAGAVTGIRFEPRELADLQAAVELR